ncbi:MAG: class I SAM-dependent DNA methyltransferase [Chloroflexota bacterium]
MESTRAAWLRERRTAVEADYDNDAPTYDDDLYPNDLHRAFVDRLLATCPAAGVILDAPCGTGRYFRQVAAAGRSVVGADQSAGMLAQARAHGIADRLEQVGLQELPFESEFDGVMTIDAMEHVPPEEWPAVVGNLHRALKPGGTFYVSLEESDETYVADAYRELSERGVPVVPGEVVEGDTGGYHFYPGRDRAIGWLTDAGFEPVAEDQDWRGEWGYRHLLLRRQ